MSTVKVTNTTKTLYFNAGTLRKVFLINENSLHRTKEKDFKDRSSTIPYLFLGLKIRIYTGRVWRKKRINRWMVGFKFGEFTWNRKIALYKAKQKKKKKNNETWMNFSKTIISNFLSTIGVLMALNFWTSLLCSRNDARCYESLRHGSIWYYFPSLPKALWFNYSSGNFDQ